MATNNDTLQGSALGQIPVQRKSWLGRNWKWLLLATFLLIVCFGLGIFALIMSWMRSSDVALEAVARAQANPAVTQKLGGRIEEGWLTSGSINVGTGGSGDANLSVPISGPKGSGTVYVTAQRIAGVWNYSQMIAGIESTGEKIDLLATSSLTPSATAPARPPVIASPAPVTAAAPATPAPAAALEPAAASVPASSSSSAPLATTDGDIQGIRIAINELKRTTDTLTLKFTVFNTSAKEFNLNGAFDNDEWHRYADLRGVYLLDPIAKKKYFVVTDSDGNYLSSSKMPTLAPGSQGTLWAKFPAPPADVAKITVAIPHFIPLEDISINR